MSTTVTFNNTSYSIPASGEVAWSALSNFLISLANNSQVTTFQKSGIRTAVSSPITVSAATDCTVISKLTVPGAVAVTLPTGVDGQMFFIVDGTGDANTNNITVSGSGGQTINGSAAYVINTARGAVGFQWSSAASDWKSLVSTSTGITLTAFGSSPNANAVTASGQNLQLQPASASFPGGVSTAAQDFAGLKHFQGGSINVSNIRASEGSGTTTLTIADNPYQVFNLSADRTVVLPTTSVKKGDEYRIANQGNFALTIQASGGQAITTANSSNRYGQVGNLGYVTLISQVDAPTTAAGWYVQCTYNNKQQVRVNTTNGYGSSSTVIRRWTNIVENVGGAITYADSATLGGTFTINEAGIYAISYSDVFSGAAIYGLSLNSSQLSTTIASITTADRLAMQRVITADLAENLAWCGYLQSGDVIRGHTDANGDSAGAKAQGTFTICKIH